MGQHYQNGSLAEVPADDWPAYLQHWVSALEKPELQLTEIQMLSPGKLAEWLTLCVSKDKKSATSYGTRIVNHLLSLKCASDVDFQRMQGTGWMRCASRAPASLLHAFQSAKRCRLHSSFQCLSPNTLAGALDWCP